MLECGDWERQSLNVIKILLTSVGLDTFSGHIDLCLQAFLRYTEESVL
jgi:hypothetical protein